MFKFSHSTSIATLITFGKRRAICNSMFPFSHTNFVVLKPPSQTSAKSSKCFRLRMTHSSVSVFTFSSCFRCFPRSRKRLKFLVPFVWWFRVWFTWPVWWLLHVCFSLIVFRPMSSWRTIWFDNFSDSYRILSYNAFSSYGIIRFAQLKSIQILDNFILVLKTLINRSLFVVFSSNLEWSLNRVHEHLGKWLQTWFGGHLNKGRGCMRLLVIHRGKFYQFWALPDSWFLQHFCAGTTETTCAAYVSLPLVRLATNPLG